MVGRGAAAVAGGGGAHAGAEAVAPRAGRCRAAGTGQRTDAQVALDHLQLGPVVAADAVQPVLVAQLIVHPVQAAWDAPGQGQADLGAEAGCQVQRVQHRIAAAAAQVQHAQVRVHFFEVGHRRDDTVLQDLDGDYVLHADAHGMAGEALGVGHHDVAGRVAEGVAQRDHLGRGAAAARRGVGLVRHEDGLAGHGVAVDAEAPLGRGHQVLHHLADVAGVQAGAVVGAIHGLAAQQLDDAPHAALTHRVLALHHQPAGAHAQDGAVAAPVEGQRGLIHPVVGGRGAQGQEAGAHPLHQIVAGDVVAAQHQHPAAAAAADPVLGDGDALRRAGAGRVDVSVGAARADVLGELAVAHAQDTEDEAAVEVVRLALHLLAQIADAAVDLVQGLQVAGVAAQVLQHGQLHPPVFPLIVVAELLSEAIAAREGAGKDHAGLVAQRFGQHPAVGQELASGGLAPGLHQRNARLAQRVQPGGKAVLGRNVQRLHQLGRHAVLLGQVELAGAAGQLEHLSRVGDDLEAARAVLRLDQAGDALVQDALAVALGDQIDELLAAQDAQGVVGVHQRLVGAWQAQAGAADHHRAQRRVVAVARLQVAGCGLHVGHGLLQHLSELTKRVRGQGRLRHDRFLGGSRGRLDNWLTG